MPEGREGDGVGERMYEGKPGRMKSRRAMPERRGGGGRSWGEDEGGEARKKEKQERDAKK